MRRKKKKHSLKRSHASSRELEEKRKIVSVPQRLPYQKAAWSLEQTSAHLPAQADQITQSSAQRQRHFSFNKHQTVKRDTSQTCVRLRKHMKVAPPSTFPTVGYQRQCGLGIPRLGKRGWLLGWASTRLGSHAGSSSSTVHAFAHVFEAAAYQLRTERRSTACHHIHICPPPACPSYFTSTQTSSHLSVQTSSGF